MRQLQKRKLIFVLLLLAVWASGCGKKQEPLREGERSYQIYYLNPSATRMVTREYRTMTVDSDTLVQELLDALMNVPADLDAQVPISEKVACQGGKAGRHGAVSVFLTTITPA